jgi:hypothetical protein
VAKRFEILWYGNRIRSESKSALAIDIATDGDKSLVITTVLRIMGIHSYQHGSK